MSDLIERLRDKARLRAAHGLTGWVLAEEALLAQAADEIERLTAERDELRRQLDPMGEYASADELIAALRAEKAEDEAMKLDARRYRDWLRGGANIPSESSRWARWEVRHWNGRHWHTLFAEALDANIDAAMGLTRPAEE